MPARLPTTYKSSRSKLREKRQQAAKSPADDRPTTPVNFQRTGGPAIAKLVERSANARSYVRATATGRADDPISVVSSPPAPVDVQSHSPAERDDLGRGVLPFGKDSRTGNSTAAGPSRRSGTSRSPSPPSTPGIPPLITPRPNHPRVASRSSSPAPLFLRRRQNVIVSPPSKRNTSGKTVLQVDVGVSHTAGQLRRPRSVTPTKKPSKAPAVDPDEQSSSDSEIESLSAAMRRDPQLFGLPAHNSAVPSTPTGIARRKSRNPPTPGSPSPLAKHSRVGPTPPRPTSFITRARDTASPTPNARRRLQQQAPPWLTPRAQADWIADRIGRAKAAMLSSPPRPRRDPVAVPNVPPVVLMTKKPVAQGQVSKLPRWKTTSSPIAVPSRPTREPVHQYAHPDRRDKSTTSRHSALSDDDAYAPKSAQSSPGSSPIAPRKCREPAANTSKVAPALPNRQVAGVRHKTLAQRKSPSSPVQTAPGVSKGTSVRSELESTTRRLLPTAPKGRFKRSLASRGGVEVTYVEEPKEPTPKTKGNAKGKVKDLVRKESEEPAPQTKGKAKAKAMRTVKVAWTVPPARSKVHEANLDAVVEVRRPSMPEWELVGKRRQRPSADAVVAADRDL